MSAIPMNSRLRASLIASGVALALVPALAVGQETDHSQHHAPPTEAAEQERASKDDHSAMDHSSHVPPAEPAEQEQSSDADHSKMDHSKDHSRAHQPPRTPIPELTEADRAAAVPPSTDHPVHDNPVIGYFAIDRLEAWEADHGTGMEWEAQGWIGTDLNRAWLRSDGERVDGHTESAGVDLLYGRSIARWWDLVAGIRHDFQPGGAQDFVALGVVGLAPYKFEVSATAYLGESGQAYMDVEVEYETLLTNRLILQPLVEFDVHARNDAGRGTGAGLSTVEAGLRLRYEITRRFAPYVGVVHERAFGRTADYRRAEGERIEDTRFVAGVRLWF